MRHLKSYGGAWRKTPVSPYGNAGVSDITGCILGRYVEIELKAPGRYKNPEDGLTALQVRHRADIIRNGGWVIVSDAWETVKLNLDFLTSTIADNMGPWPTSNAL